MNETASGRLNPLGPAPNSGNQIRLKSPFALTKAACLPYKPREFERRCPCGKAGENRPGDGTLTIRRYAATSGDHTRETDLSTEQARAEAPSRIPRPHGHRRWPQGRRHPPRARSQAPQRLTWRAEKPALLQWNV